MAKLKQEDLQAIEKLVKEAVAEAVPAAVDSAFDAERQAEVYTIAQIVAETYRAMAKQEAAELARAHGRMLEAAAMIEEVASRGELDVSMLGDEANKRAYALAVAMAERAIVHTESALSEIREYIEEAEVLAAAGGCSDGKKSNLRLLSREWGDRAKRLLVQEKAVAERLETERQCLANLKLS